MANDVEKLLRYIVRQFLAREDAVEIDRDASASEPGTSIAQDKQRASQMEQARISRLSDPFREGLRRADDARRAGGNAISLDDRKEDENRQADALVNFLVRTRLATSNTREAGDSHYIYTISIDWEKLDAVAKDARTNLQSILGHSG